MERVPVNAMMLAVGLAVAIAATAEAAPAPTPSPRTALAQAPAAGKAPAAKAAPAPGSPAAAKAEARADKDKAHKDKDDKDKDDKDREGPGGRKKTREGSVLKSDKLLPGYVDLRSDAERKRDEELKMHFARIAELDVIAGVAEDTGDTGLGEYVEQVRRKEVQRHQKVMMALKRAMAQAGALATGAQP